MIQLKKGGVYLVADYAGNRFYAEWEGSHFWIFGCDEPIHYFPNPNDIPENQILWMRHHVANIIKDVSLIEILGANND